MGYKFSSYYSIATGTSASQTVIGPIDISRFDKFCLVYQNITDGSMSELQVQAAIDPSAVVGMATNWVQINTSTLPQPSGLGSGSTVMTTAVDNVYRFIRVQIRPGASAAANKLRLIIAGFERYT